ncbi:T9SS type A sorting domain-containing protein [bacterium]|nr:T9SS type A sorting domain-containing protein [bacterium]
MTRIYLISVAILIIAVGAFASTDAVKPLLGGVHLPIYGQPIRVDYTHSFSPMELDTIPPFDPYHDLPLYIAGDTYYDMQHNCSKGRNIAVDHEGGVHVAWMDGITPTFSQRRAKYNYFHIDSVTGGDPSTGWVCAYDGAQADGRDKAGYVNIAVDDVHTVPTVTYHDVEGATNPKTNAAFDGMYYATAGASRCVFIQPIEGPDPYYVPEDPTFDCSAIWPKIAQIDTTVFLVSSCSNNLDTIPATGEPCGERVIYYRGFVKPDIVSIASMSFEPAIEIENDQVDISCDITAWKGTGETEVTMGYIRRDTLVEADTCYCTAESYFTTVYDAAALMIRRSTDMGDTWAPTEYITEPGVHIYSDYPESLYIGWSLDSSVTPPETVQNYSPVYTRPVDFNITYSPDGVLHAVWGGFVLSPHEGWETSCAAACSVGAYSMEVIYHWDDARDVIDTVTWDPWWLFQPPTDYRPSSQFRTSQYGASHEPQVTVDDDGNVFVFWEQRWSEYWWCQTGTLLIDNSLLNYPNSDIYCAVYNPDSGYWSDPVNISNTTTPGCSTGVCLSEVEVTVADRVDDNVHISFIVDYDAGLYLLEEGEVTLDDFVYLRIPKDYLLTTAYTGIYESERLNPDMPLDFRLGSGYPNPFNAATAFWFDTYTPGKFKIDIIDMTGRTVTEVHDGDLRAGRRRFVWDGFSDNGWFVPSGTYFLRASDDLGNTITRKVTLIK